MAPSSHNETLFTNRANTFKLRDFSGNLSETIWCEFDVIILLILMNKFHLSYGNFRVFFFLAHFSVLFGVDGFLTKIQKTKMAAV